MKGRPVRLLGLPKSGRRKNQHVYDRNLQESPLLCLPAEIRTEIWRMLFGGSQIIVRCEEDTWALTHSVCTWPMHNLKLVASWAKSGNYRPPHGNHVCDSPWNSDKKLDILRVCRQIHLEAALLPFSDNTFSFASYAAMYVFLEDMISQQVRAIKTVSLLGFFQFISTPSSSSRTSAKASKEFRRLVRRSMAHVDDLTVAMQVSDFVDAWIFTHDASVRERMVDQLSLMNYLSPNKVRCAVYYDDTVPQFAVIPSATARAWEADLEARLLAPYDPQKMNGQKAERRREW